MGKMVPLEDLPPEARASIRPGTPSFAAYALQLEKDNGLPLGSLSGRDFGAKPDTDALWLLQSAAREEAKLAAQGPQPSAAPAQSSSPPPYDPTAGDANLQFGPWDTGIRIPQGVNRALADRPETSRAGGAVLARIGPDRKSVV